ncbi:MAG: class I SAM-dependent methyltransferase [Alphaproteobacteria bacterium]|nr:class I SAM-dependent methyltransferase [Alphaproteobacteria bacterium]
MALAQAKEAPLRRHSGPCIDSVADYGIIDCASCGYRHVLPLPDPAAAEALYTHDYYGKEKPAYLAHANEDAEWLTLHYADRLRIAESALAGHKGRRLLDVGAGPGFFAAHALSAGYDVTAIEPSAQAAEHGRSLGLDIREETYSEALADTLGPVDVVHMMNVLEHVPDPDELLARAFDQLRPGGVLIVGVPNDYSPFQTTLRRARDFRPWWVAPPHHLNYFDFASLSRLLVRTGFEVAERYTSFPMDLFLLLGENYIEEPARGRECHERRKALDLDLEAAGHGAVRRAFYGALAEAGLGREAILFARKPRAPHGA